MDQKKIISISLLNALGVIIYISLVAFVMLNSENLFGQMDNLWGPVGFLLLFTVSAAITGLLVLGRPAYLFLNGQKTEAVKMLIYTVAGLFGATVIYLFILAVLK